MTIPFRKVKLLSFYAVLTKMFLTCYTRDSACSTLNELLTMQANNTEYKTEVKLLNLQRSKMQFLRIRKRDSLNFNCSFILLFHLRYSNLKASFQELRNRDFAQEDITLKNIHIWSKTNDPTLPSTNPLDHNNEPHIHIFLTNWLNQIKK